MARRGGTIAWAVALVLAVGVGVATWWFAFLPGQRARETAQAVAAGLASGTPDDALFTEPVAERLAAIYRGMGELRPTVTVARLEPVNGTFQRIHLHFDWVIHEGKPSWSYDTVVGLLRRDGPHWRAVFAPEAVAVTLEPGETLRATRLAATRGEVVGQDGAHLVWNQPAHRVGIDKTLTDAATAEASAARLAELLGIDAERFVARVAASGPRAFVEARVLRAELPEEAALTRQAQQWIGVRVIGTTRPLALSSSFARPLLGVVAEATAEQVAASGGTIRAGDLVGRGGLQEARQHVLGGTTGFVIEKVTTTGRGVELFRVGALDGTPVRTTLDVGAQQAAEAVLAGIASPSAVVALRPSDGAVIAAASGPGSEGFSTATLGQYAPGSTMKIVTALAMLRAGATPDTVVPCTDGYVVDGRRFDNWEGYPADALGDVPLTTAFAHSCNSAFLAQAATLGPDRLADAAGSLGLTVEKNLVVGAFSGQVPADGTPAERAAAFIGQGRVLASPLGMATVTASVAAGRTVDPVLVLEPGRVEHRPVTPLTVTEAATLRDLMGGPVAVGTAAALQPLGDVVAKTGTASWGSPVRHHGWVCVIHGDLAVAVFIEDAAAGSGDAVAAARDFLVAIR